MTNQPLSSDKADRRSGQISLTRLIPLILAGLVVLAVLPVLVTGFVISSDTATRLLNDRNELIVDGLENTIRDQLDPVSTLLNFARKAIRDGIVDPTDDDGLRNFTRGLLAGSPQVAGVALNRVNVRRHARFGYGDSGLYAGAYRKYYGR